MRIFSWQLFGNPLDIAAAIGEVAFSLKAPFFQFPDEDGFDFRKEWVEYTKRLQIIKTPKQMVGALQPQGSGWEIEHARIGIFRPLTWGQSSKKTRVRTEVVGYLDFAPSPFERYPNTLLVYEMESQSNFVDALLTTFNKTFEQYGFLKSTTDFKMEHLTTRYSDVSAENKGLLRELKELRTQLGGVTELRERVQKLEQEAKTNKSKQQELESLRQEIFPPSYQLPSGTLSVKEERLNALLQTQRIYYRNLNEMEKRAAYFGLNIPLEVVNQIDYFKGKVEEIEKEINALERNKK